MVGVDLLCPLGGKPDCCWPWNTVCPNHTQHMHARTQTKNTHTHTHAYMQAHTNSVQKIICKLKKIYTRWIYMLKACTYTQTHTLAHTHTQCTKSSQSQDQAIQNTHTPTPMGSFHWRQETVEFQRTCQGFHAKWPFNGILNGRNLAKCFSSRLVPDFTLSDVIEIIIWPTNSLTLFMDCTVLVRPCRPACHWSKPCFIEHC